MCIIILIKETFIKDENGSNVSILQFIRDASAWLRGRTHSRTQQLRKFIMHRTRMRYFTYIFALFFLIIYVALFLPKYK